MPDGSKIPGTLEGISVHRGQVAGYEHEFGKVREGSRDTYEKTYAAIRSGVEHQRQRDAANAARRKRAEAYRALQKQREAANRAAIAEARSERAHRAHAREIERANRLRPYYEDRMASAEWNCHQNRERADRLRANLATEKYEKSRHVGSYRKALARVEELADYFAGRITYYQRKLDALPEVD